MNKLVAARNLVLLLALLTMPLVEAHAQSTPTELRPEELLRTIASLDAALFDSAFGDQCDLERFGSFFTDDVEFYHDQSGVTLGRQSLTDSIEKNICGKVRRELVPGTLEVYPMHGFGAVEIGVHRFYQRGGSTEPVGEARFVHLWQSKGGTWRITRVISYDHRTLPKGPAASPGALDGAAGER